MRPLARKQKAASKMAQSNGAAPAPRVVVTGASEGIGLALARRFAKAGHDLLLVARSAAGLEAAAKAIREDYKVQVSCLAVDLSRPEGPAAVEAALAAANVYADILVNNAGFGLGGAFFEQDREDVLRMIDLNIRGATDLMHRLLPGMRQRRRGGILNVASLGGYMPGPYQAAYYASKAYLISLSEAVAAEVWGEGVRICVLAPGPVATKFHERMGTETAFYRYVLWARSAEMVAASGYRGYQWRQRVIVPGLEYKLAAVVSRFVPHAVLMPILALLLKRRISA